MDNTQNKGIFDLEDKKRLELTQSIRELGIKNLTKDGKFPDVQEDREALVKLLDGMDRTTLAKTKIKTDDNNSKNNNDIQKMMAKFLTSLPNNTNNVSERTLPIELDTTIDLNTIVDGERYVGVENMDYETFMSKNDPDFNG